MAADQHIRRMRNKRNRKNEHSKVLRYRDNFVILDATTTLFVPVEKCVDMQIPNSGQQ